MFNKKEKKEKKKVIPLSNIPYHAIYPDKELNIIEISPNHYSKLYLIKDMNNEIKDWENETVSFRYSNLLNCLDDNVKIQICINNKNSLKTDKDKYLIDSNSNYKTIINEYNDKLNKLLDKRKNNIVKEKYIILSVEADLVDSARDIFIENEKKLYKKAKEIADSEISIIPVVKSLEILHNLYNPGAEQQFKIRYQETNNLDSNTMKKKKITSKNIIVPSVMNEEDDYIELDNKVSTTLYLSNIPSHIADNIISDLTNLNINMITSIHFSPIDPENALKNLKADKDKLIKAENEKIVNKKPVRKTVMRDNKATEIDTEIKINDKVMERVEKELEKAYKYEEKLFFMTLLITHYSDDLDTLDRNTEILKGSAFKFLCKLSTCTYNQLEAFKASLPLGYNKLDLFRVLNSKRASYFTPFAPQEVLRKNGICYGYNAINNDLVMINRKNSKVPSGFILGADKSGKTVAMKREIISNYINTKEKVIIISGNKDYDNFIDKLKGQTISELNINPLDTNERYSDIDDAKILKHRYILSLFTILNNGGLNKENKSYIKEITKFLEDNQFQLCIQDIMDNFKDEKYNYINRLLSRVPDKFRNITKVDYENNDFTLIKTDNSLLENIVAIDYAWNKMVENGVKGEKTWIYIDNIEQMFNYKATSNLMIQLFQRILFWEGVLTLSSQNTNILIESSKQSIKALNLLQNSGYIKLLNTSPLDRDVLNKYLNISSMYMPYITNTTHGNGLILTHEGNFAFKEIFNEDDNIFKLLVI